MKLFFNALIITLPLTCFSSAEAAQKYIAETIKIRGEVSQLAPGNKAAKMIALGDKFVEDTSILTGPKSFIKIKFADNSEINVGPESKIVISEMKTNEPGVISLLKGKIRTSVEKNAEKDETKFFVKTRTAAMGVRGTEFQTIYNPDNKVTSLLTYHGAVKMAKLDDNQYRKIEDAEKKADESATTSTTEVKPQTELNKVLDNNSSVTVLGGQNSIATEFLKKATLPVVISPVQLNVLYKNEDFKEKDESNKKPINTESLKEVKMDIKPVEQVVSKEGVNNPATGDFAPKAYGYIDLQTGLYVSPEKLADNSANTVVQNEKRVGTIDSDTGEYIAPVGLKLDAKKGFVVDGKANDPKIVALKNDLNQNIGSGVVVDIPKEEIKFNINDKFIQDQLLFSIFIGDQKLQLNPNQNNSQFYEVNADKENIHLDFEWRMSSLNRFRTLVGVKIADVSFSTLPSNFSSESDRLYSMYIGGMYALNRNFDAVVKIGQYQEHYTTQSSSNYTLSKMTLTKLSLGFHSEFFNDKQFNLEFDLNGNFHLRKRLNAMKVKEGLGLDFLVGTRLKASANNSIFLGFAHESQKARVLSSSSENRQERDSKGIIIQYRYSY